MELEPKTIAESATSLSQIILPGQTNPAGTAHGGELLKMMDNCAELAPPNTLVPLWLPLE